MFVGELFRQKGNDGERFGQYGIAEFECGDLGLWIDGEIFGGLNLCAELDGDDGVFRTAFFQHPYDVCAA